MVTAQLSLSLELDNVTAQLSLSTFLYRVFLLTTPPSNPPRTFCLLPGSSNFSSLGEPTYLWFSPASHFSFHTHFSQFLFPVGTPPEPRADGAGLPTPLRTWVL